MNKIKKLGKHFGKNFLKKVLLSLFVIGAFAIGTQSFVVHAQNSKGANYNEELQKYIGDTTQKKLDPITINDNRNGGQNIAEFLITKVIAIVIPIVIALGVIFAIIGFYRVIFSESPEMTKTGIKYMVYGIIGILVMMSARYLTDVLAAQMFKTGGTRFDFTSITFARDLYEKIAFPFLKIAFYLVIGFLFVVLVGQVFKYLFSTDDKMKKTAGTIITWNIVGVLVILIAKQLIEAVYGTQEKVLNQKAQALSGIGDAALTTKELPLVYTIINWVMSLTALVVLIIIIVQGYRLLTNPTDSEQFKRLKKSIIYVFAGILIIGAGYVITNFLIIQ